MKIFAVLIAFFATVCFFPVHVFAQQEFTTTLHATYVVNTQGQTTVKNEIRIKNNFSSIYAKQYALEVSSNRLEKVKAFTPVDEPIDVNTTQTDTKTSIAIVFPDKVIGKDQERVFTVQYEQPDVSILAGSVLEVDVPKLVQQDAFDEYTVTIQVPAQFGDPAISNPTGYGIIREPSATTLNYIKNTKDGVNVIFGQKQVYSFLLQYHLDNPSISQGISQIALPPDTLYQKMIYTSIEPKPEKIEQDEDGNWIATVIVGSQKEVQIDARGYVVVYLHPTVQLSAQGQKADKAYTVEQKYWEVNDSSVQALAQQYRTPKDIYSYLVNSYTYNYDRLTQQIQNRMGAAQAIKSPDQVLCQEFTDTFIAVARAQGIPAREINGYAYTENQRLRPLSLVSDVLHAWPEYFDAQKHQWVPIDPTWGNTTGGVDFFTKMDFNHIVFAIHGKSSEKPYPAGVYKIPGKEQKDVTIQVAPAAPAEVPDINLEIDQNSSAKLGFSRKATLTVTNRTGSAWYDIPVTITTSDGLLVSKDTQRLITTLLPFQTVEVPVFVQAHNSLVQQTGQVTIEVEGETVTYDVTTERNFLPVYVGIGVVGFAAIAGCVLVLRKRR